MLLRRAGERVAGHPLQVGLQLGIAAGDLDEELPPGRAIIASEASRRGRGDLGHPVGAVVGTLPAGLEIDHATGRVEQPRVGIPFGRSGRVSAIRARQPFHTADGAGGGELGGDLRVVGVDSGVTANASGQVGGCQRVLGAPAVAIPHQPAAPCGDVAPVAVVAPGKGQRQCILGTPHGFVAADDRFSILVDVVHLEAWAVGEEGRDVETLGHGVRRIPAVRRLLGRVQDVASLRAR